MGLWIHSVTNTSFQLYPRLQSHIRECSSILWLPNTDYPGRRYHLDLR